MLRSPLRDMEEKKYLKAERKIIIWFARYRKPTSGSEYIFRVRGKTNDRNDEAWEIIVYFELGRKYSDIKSILASRHAFHISERHLKRILRDRGHFLRKAFSDLSVLVDFISDQLQYSGQLHGYRWMYAKCREHGLRVRKEDVRLLLKELDPRGVSRRLARRLRRRN